MPSDARKQQDKTYTLITKTASNIFETMVLLIAFFKQNINKDTYARIEDNWNAIKALNRISSGKVAEYLADNVTPILSSYIEDIKNKNTNMGKILEENDYTKHIIEDCDPKTESLIREMIPTVKKLFIEGDDRTKKIMDNIVTNLVKLSYTYQNAINQAKIQHDTL